MRIALTQPSVSGYVSRLSLKFDDPLEWAECSRILMEAKSHLLHRKQEFQEQLNEVLTHHSMEFTKPVAKVSVVTSTCRATSFMSRSLRSTAPPSLRALCV